MKNKGFSLIEVIVAVAILSIASVAIMKNFSQNLFNIGKVSTSLEYSYGLKFYYNEAIEQYGKQETEEIQFEDDNFKYLFNFSEPEFLKDNKYVNKVPGLNIVLIKAKVVLKNNDKELTEAESYHVFKEIK